MINFLVDRSDISPLLLKKVWEYTLDKRDEKGEMGKHETSKDGMQMIAKYISDFESLSLSASYIEKEDVTIPIFEETLLQGGCIVYRCYSDVPHYVLLTKMDEDSFYLFDPWYVGPEILLRNTEQVIGEDDYNRRILKTRLNESISELFALPPIDERDAILFKNLS